MNAVTRVYQEQLGLNPFAGMIINGYHVAISLLFLCVFAFAVGVVYMKDLNRRLFIQDQSLQQMQQQFLTTLQCHWRKQGRAPWLQRSLRVDCH